jgi:4-amino-4-deoxy-L-arabinose transferase-like glycosyltransferase
MFKISTNEKLILIILIALFLRVWNLELNPASLNQDEAVNGVDAFTLGINLADHHGNFLPPMLQSFNDWASPTLTYFTVPFVKLLGLNIFSVRLANAFFGVLCVPLIFSIIRRLTQNKNVALITAFITALTPFMVSLSRWAIPPSIVPFCLLFFIWSVIRLLDSNYSNPKQVWVNNALVTFSATSMVYSYPTMKIFGPLAALLLLAVYFRTHLKKLLPSIAIFFLLISPIFYLTLSQPSVYNARYDSVKVTAGGESMIGGFAARYWEYLTPYFIVGHSDSNSMHHVPNFGPINEILGFAIYLGIIVCYTLFKNKNEISEPNDNRLYLYLLGLLIIAPIAPSLTIDHTILTRGIQVLVLSLIFVGLGINYLDKVIKDINFKKVILSFFTVIFLFSSAHFLAFYSTDYVEQSKGAFQYGIKEMYSYLKENEDKFDRVGVTDINQPYIYYMFFNSIKPGGYKAADMACEIGKYYFCGVDKNSVNGKTALNTIKDEKGKTWFYVYEKSPRNWIVFR